MSSTPLVSIALCTYNGEKFLNKQLTSILSQTHGNIELIIVDDFSTDNTVKLIKAFQKTDQRIKLIINESNIGYNQNFQKAISLCTGDFISISDQDDIWLNHKIETLLQAIGPQDMVYCNSAFIDANDQLTGQFIINPERNQEDFQHYKNILMENFVTGHNALFRRDALQKIFPFPEASFYDWWMGFIMLYENKLAYCNQVLTHYRTHESSVMNVINNKHRSNSKLNQFKTTNTIINQVKNFANYKAIKEQDRLFLQSLVNALQVKRSSYYSFSLFNILLSNFGLLFPKYSSNPFKRIYFIYRYCRGFKLLNLLRK